MAAKRRKKQDGLPPRAVSILRIVHPFPSLVVTAVTVALAVSARVEPALSTVVALGLGMLCYQFAIGVANDIVDAADDARTKPWKAIPRGAVGRRPASILAVGLGAMGMVVTSGLPFGAWLVGIGGFACGLAYDVQLKRTPWSWVPLAVALPLVPVWVFLALDAWDGLLWWVFPLGALLGLSVHLANQAADVPKEPAGAGIAHRLGTERSANLALGLLGLAGAVGVVLMLVAGAPTQALLIAAAVLLAGVLARRAVLVFGADGLFGLFATSAAAIAVVFISAAR